MWAGGRVGVPMAPGKRHHGRAPHGSARWLRGRASMAAPARFARWRARRQSGSKLWNGGLLQIFTWGRSPKHGEHDKHHTTNNTRTNNTRRPPGPKVLNASRGLVAKPLGVPASFVSSRGSRVQFPARGPLPGRCATRPNTTHKPDAFRRRAVPLWRLFRCGVQGPWWRSGTRCAWRARVVQEGMRCARRARVVRGGHALRMEARVAHGGHALCNERTRCSARFVRGGTHCARRARVVHGGTRCA